MKGRIVDGERVEDQWKIFRVQVQVYGRSFRGRDGQPFPESLSFSLYCLMDKESPRWRKWKLMMASSRLANVTGRLIGTLEHGSHKCLAVEVEELQALTGEEQQSAPSTPAARQGKRDRPVSSRNRRPPVPQEEPAESTTAVEGAPDDTPSRRPKNNKKRPAPGMPYETDFDSDTIDDVQSSHDDEDFDDAPEQPPKAKIFNI